MTRTELIQELIRLGEISREYWSEELPKRHPKYPIVQEGEDSGPLPLADRQIRDLLQNLTESELYILLTLMYLGRGDFDLDHLKSGYAKMQRMFTKREMIIDQLAGKPGFSEYLMDAMDEIKQRHIDLDNPSFEVALSK